MPFSTHQKRTLLHYRTGTQKKTICQISSNRGTLRYVQKIIRTRSASACHRLEKAKPERANQIPPFICRDVRLRMTREKKIEGKIEGEKKNQCIINNEHSRCNLITPLGPYSSLVGHSKSPEKADFA
ncbi:hypothetical protein ES288_A05G194300v1 [Gossypium darwinii]|uniref:Uncharacterized protein n=1 Tax=Gossypium darwinii TaxID=34276 RepID=A0A5D2GH94_GOSDA|nr:hypothetical protein ES288_A05G194300v1 [Gossypium darwinii]